MTATSNPARPSSRSRRPAARLASGSRSSKGQARSDQTLWVALDWIERHDVVPDGFRKGAPFQLYHYQGQYLAHMYLVRGSVEWDPVNPVLGPAFVYSRGLLVAPQKVGKNPLIAAQVTLEGVGPALFAGWAGVDDGYVCRDHGCRCGWEYPYRQGDPMGMPWPTPLIQITAFSEDSTENTYDALRPMIEEGPLADVIPKTGEQFIRLPGGGRIDTVTSSNQSRLGARSTFVPQDELGLWTPQNKMVKLADTQYRNLSGMGGRASLTSNAWDPAEHSVAQREFESSADDIYRQFVQPPKNLSYTDRRERHKIHLIVYPEDVRRENGGHLDLDSIEAEAAKIAETDPQQAMRFYGDILVAGAGHAVEPDVWDALERHRDVRAGTQIGLAFDGSISQDATVLRACTADGYGFAIKSWVRPIGPAMITWQAAHPGESWAVDRLDVAETLAATFARYRVGRMICDPPKWWTEVATWQQTYTKEIVQALETNQASRFAPACDRWLTAIREGTHTHDDDLVANDHVKAAHLKKVHIKDDEGDGRTLYVIIKGDDRRKIDAAVADILALEAAMSMPALPGPSIYESRGIRTIGGHRR